MPPPPPLRLGLPKGRIASGALKLLEDAGIQVQQGARAYRPTLSLEGVEAKALKPRAVVEMLALGSRDLGFAGGDLVQELDADVVTVCDTELDPVKVVLAVPPGLLVDGTLPARRLRCATEYPRLTARYAAAHGFDFDIIPSYGATEVLPPEDADLIVDNTATGATLAANGLAIHDIVVRSSTKLLASQAAMRDPSRRQQIEDLALLLRSVLEARRRVMLELNVDEAALERIVAALPCMREPTVAPLYGESGFAIKAAVPRRALPTLLPELKRLGGSALVITKVEQLVP